jgi:8-oxo-dGTP pyrophosphatase MutT (NUDIX family)
LPSRGTEKRFVFWATPGGEVEPGETGLETAKREIKEELAVNVELTGPVHTAVDRFMHNGAFVESNDIFFVGGGRTQCSIQQSRELIRICKRSRIEQLIADDPQISTPERFRDLNVFLIATSLFNLRSLTV